MIIYFCCHDNHLQIRVRVCPTASVLVMCLVLHRYVCLTRAFSTPPPPSYTLSHSPCPPHRPQTDDDDFFGGFSSGSGLAGLSSTSSGGWGKSTSSSSSWEKTPSAPPARRPPPPADTSRASCGDDAQKKFGNAKAISSAAYFGDERPSVRDVWDRIIWDMTHGRRSNHGHNHNTAVCTIITWRLTPSWDLCFGFFPVFVFFFC